MCIHSVTDRGKKLVVQSNVLTFYDLASSSFLTNERQSTVALNDSQNVDKSICTLGICIKALSRSSRKRASSGRCVSQ
jgi:hypothetical protein